jgi:hypothetical protein
MPIPTEPPAFFKTMKVSDTISEKKIDLTAEKKFFLNKNLFENPFIKPLPSSIKKEEIVIVG